MWSKGIRRSSSSEKRMEEMSPIERYLSKVEWVDMGHDVLYARNDYPLNYKDGDPDSLLSFDDILDIMKKLPEGVYIANRNHIKWIQDNCRMIKYQDDDDKLTGKITSICVMGKKHDYIHFNLHPDTKEQMTKYYLNNFKYTGNDNLKALFFDKFCDNIEITTIGPKRFPSYLGTPIRVPILKMDAKTKQYMIKLVKLKDGDKKI